MQKILDDFLSEYRDIRISVYGTGLNAERVIRSVRNYNFVAVISNDPGLIGGKFHGIRIVSLEEALLWTDVILIATIPSSARIVYERIRAYVPDTIPIFELSGIQLNKKNGYMDCYYWGISNDDLMNAIDRHEIISFDAFDTLLMRRVFYPRDIFEIIDDISDWDASFKDKWNWQVRINAECELYQEGKHPNIFEIYDRIKESRANDISLSEDQIDIMTDREILLERKLTVKRKSLYEAFYYALSKKKKIYVVSDMYLTKPIIDMLLSNRGITGYTDIFVSCEYGCNKGSGELFKKLKEITGSDDILHIGDSPDADIEGAKKEGIDTFRVFSPEALLRISSIAHIANHIGNKWDRLVLGHILSDLSMFNSAFTLGKYRGKIFIDSVETMTELCFVPITMLYISWLVGKLKNKENSLVLFCSRDGYLLEKIYGNIRDSDPKLRLPGSKYFYTSRKAMSEIIASDETGIRALCSNLDQYRKIGIVSHLEKMFGVSLSSDLKQYIGKCIGDVDPEKLVNDLMRAKEKIIHHADDRYMNYRRYVDTLSLDSYEEVYLVDLIAQGSSRYGLSRLCKREVKLLALGTTVLPNAFIREADLSDSLYGTMVTGVGSAVSTMFNLLELVYASRDGQLSGFTKEGDPVFDDGTRYNGKLLDKAQERILSFIENYADRKWYLREYDLRFSDAMLGILHPEYSDVSEDVGRLFDFNDPLRETLGKYNVLEDVRGDVI